MANELSTAGIKIKYCVETTAGTRPTTGFTQIPNVKDIPAMNSEPSSLECTDLSATEWKSYIDGLRDPGGAIGLTVNLTSAFKTAWSTLVTSAETAKATSKACWFEIAIPNMDSFYFAGMPCDLGFGGASVDAVLETTAYIVPNEIVGFAVAST